jgi:hypothetical protein
MTYFYSAAKRRPSGALRPNFAPALIGGPFGERALGSEAAYAVRQLAHFQRVTWDGGWPELCRMGSCAVTADLSEIYKDSSKFRRQIHFKRVLFCLAPLAMFP